MNKENNELMAKFLGYVQPHPNYPKSTIWYKENEQPLAILLFDTDWNWLMEVVEKIENLGFEFFIVESRCTISHNTDKSIKMIIGFEIIGTKIEATYKGCLDFIKMYNLKN